VELCRSCARALPRRDGRRGRSSVYCSAACRQKAYRSRHAPPSGDPVPDLIAGLERRLRTLLPQPPDAFRADVGALAASVDRLDLVAELAVATGDLAFAGLVEPYHQELTLHCYRLLGSFDDAGHLVREALLVAARDGQPSGTSTRSWLHQVATLVCLDFLQTTRRRPLRGGRIPWLQPYPDRLLGGEAREAVELVFVVALQHLPPRQRAVLLLRDVLGWPAARTAAGLELTVASANGALQRARPTLRKYLPERHIDWSGPADALDREEHAVLARYVAAVGDPAALAGLLGADVTVSRRVDCRALPTAANRQPAAARYVRSPGTAVYRAEAIDVLRIDGGLIVEITSFEPHLFPAFGLPGTLGH
jgi:RNA polymerase sigma-70 factor (ECF subfamily)